MRKAKAGRTLHIATAKVAVVYFIPVKYKLRSITGLYISFITTSTQRLDVS